MSQSDSQAVQAAAQSPADLKAAFLALKQKEPGLRARDAAARLGVSEGELVACRIGDGITRLKPEWAQLLNGLPAVGRVMSLVRNDSMVHERKGVFENVKVPNNIHGIILGEDIDLRLFLGEWHAAFIVQETVSSGDRTSIQIFDKAGDAVEKIYLLEDSNWEAFSSLAGLLTDDEQVPGLQVTPYPAFSLPAPLDEDKVAQFREAWSGMKDVHQLFGMLKKFGIDRLRALEAIGEDWARPVENVSFRRVLEGAARHGNPIMAFVGNKGIIQIHTGPVERLKEMGPWFNVLDPDFNLHAREDHIGQCWLVRKPTKDGIVSSLEVFNTEGELIIQLFGKRIEGEREDPAWRSVLDSILSWDREAA